MLNKCGEKRGQIQFFCTDDLVPADHILRKIDSAIDWSFIYDLVEDKYCADNGRPSINPIMLIKIPMIQYLFGIKSMRQTIKEIEVNIAYRWFLGLDFTDRVPHFSTFGKNYKRRFEGTDIFEQIFSRILEECVKHNLVNMSEVFVDATHVKACANNKKFTQKIAQEEALFYEDKLKREIDEGRKEHGKKPLKDKENDHNDDDDGEDGPSNSVNDLSVTDEINNDGNAHNDNASVNGREEKESTTDPDSGWFHKGRA